MTWWPRVQHGLRLLRPRPLLQALRRIDRDRALLAGAALLLALALLRPSWPVQRALFNHVVVIDVTQSMNVRDQVMGGGQAMSRLDGAKLALQHALLRLPCGSKVGWALFTEYRSYLLLAPVEVCENLQELRATLAQIDGRMAWSGNSEIAKGLFSGIRTAAQLPDKPSLVFITDGQEAPPVNPRRRPTFDGQPGAVPGLIVGVGGPVPQPIPKRDPADRPLGFWSADEVQQTDPRDERDARDARDSAGAPGRAGGGGEHLSSLREAYLRTLAGDTGLVFTRLDEASTLADALTAPALARPAPARADLRPLLALLALVLLLARQARLAPKLAWAAQQARRLVARFRPQAGGGATPAAVSGTGAQANGRR